MGIPLSQEDKIHESAIIAEKKNKGEFSSSYIFVFAGFRKGLSADNLPY